MSGFDVSPAAPHELLPACRLLFAGDGPEQARERLLASGAASGLFVARRGGRVCAAALAQALPGAMGVTCPPRGDAPDAEDAALAAACAWLRRRGARVCQAFATAAEAHLMGPLERAGFRRITDLAFLGCDLGDALPAGGSGLHFRAERPPFSDEFLKALLDTHEGSLDCPELNGPRTPGELLDGFTADGFGGWCLAARGGEPVGLFALAAPAADPASADLTYIGVVPGHRGRGLGAELLAAAATAARLAGARALNVSVDARNGPALRLYARFGFAEVGRRGVWLAAWPG